MADEPIQVVGGGFSGLSLAYFLAKSGRKVRLVESGSRLGGMLRSLDTPFGMVETGANALIASKLVEDTADDLGVPLTEAEPTAKSRYIFRDGEMRRWPVSFGATFGLLTGVLPKLFLSRASLAPRSGENLRSWGQRVLGAEATDYLLVPALSGVYAGDANDLSASLILGRFFDGRPRPKKGRLRGSVAPRAGMEDWIKGYRRALKSLKVEMTTEAADFTTVVALPPAAAADFLRDRAPGLSSVLGRVDPLPLVSVTAFFPLASPGIEGFGCLFPRSEGFRALGALANDRIFKDRSFSCHSETWIFGGATDRGATEITDPEMLSLVVDERKRLLGTAAYPFRLQISRWPRALPHYNLELEKALPDLAKVEGKYRLFGTYLGDLGLARVLARAESLSRTL